MLSSLDSNLFYFSKDYSIKFNQDPSSRAETNGGKLTRQSAYEIRLEGTDKREDCVCVRVISQVSG